MKACCCSTARIIATREESMPDVVRRGRSSGEGVTSACTSASRGRRPSMVTATQVPGTGWLWCSTNRPVGSVTAVMPPADRSKQPTSSTGPKRFFIARTIRKPGVAVALEVEHHVDEVLEDPRAGDRAVLGHVADDHRGDVARLGHPDQRGRDLLDLGDTPGDALDARRADGLHRVDDQQGRAHLLDVAEHGAEVGLGREEAARRGRRRCGRRAAAPGRRTPRR